MSSDNYYDNTDVTELKQGDFDLSGGSGDSGGVKIKNNI